MGYPSDVSDAEWQVTAPLLAAAKPGGVPEPIPTRCGQRNLLRESRRRCLCSLCYGLISKIALSLGLSPKSEEDSLQAALQSLSLNERSMGSLGSSIRDWRERLAEELRGHLREHNLA
jgi:hypothetical protein